MRISRALALAGIGSRRTCEGYVSKGQVTVNGETVLDLGRQVDVEADEIRFRGRYLEFGSQFVYYLFHKPAGIKTTSEKEEGKENVYDFLPYQLAKATRQPGPVRTRVFPVGRLDRDTTGLLLFTNDGVLANRLMHPRYQVDRWYEVRLHRVLEPGDQHKILEGVWLEDGKAKIEKIQKVSRRTLRLLIREGKKREIRRVFARFNYKVVTLCRIAFGPLTLGSLPPGGGRFLTPGEVAKLKEALAVKRCR